MGHSSGAYLEYVLLQPGHQTRGELPHSRWTHAIPAGHRAGDEQKEEIWQLSEVVI